MLLGNGDGSFQPPANHPQSVQSTAQQYSIVITDFNNDGKPDLAINAGTDTLAVLLGNGDGTFGAPTYFFDGGGVSLVSADFNGDGKPDLAASGPAGIAILLGNGDGTFQPATFPITQGSAQFTADLNGDGKADLIGGADEVYLGNGDGTFTALPLGPLSPVYGLADINGDGKLDGFGMQDPLCCGFSSGNGDGTFGPYIPILNITGYRGYLQYSPTFMLAADMNGDGKPDLILAPIANDWTNYFPTGIFVLINTIVPETVKLSPASLGFGSESVGVSSQPQATTLTNTGSLPLTISSIGITGANSGDFSQTNTCGNSVPGGGTCTINVTFTPTAAGVRAGSLVVTDDAPGSPQQVSLSGTGISSSLALGVAPGGSSSATVAAGAMATYKLSIGGSGFSGMVSLTCAGAPQGANCSFPSGATMNVSGGSASPFNVTVTTTSRAMAAFSQTPTGSRSWLCAALLIGVVILPNAKPWKRSACRIIRLSPLMLLVLLGACGGGGSTSTNPIGTPTGTYALTVTATSGSVNQSQPLTLTVQ